MPFPLEKTYEDPQGAAGTFFARDRAGIALSPAILPGRTLLKQPAPLVRLGGGQARGITDAIMPYGPEGILRLTTLPPYFRAYVPREQPRAEGRTYAGTSLSEDPTQPRFLGRTQDRLR